jgi:phosphatidate phosphatase APP1
MSLKTTLAWLLHPIERRIDLLKGERDGPVQIHSYGGYQTPDGTVLRGRILSVGRTSTVYENQSRFRNAWQFLRLFVTDERAQVPVRVLGTSITTNTDDEGYFHIVIPRDTALPDGPATVAVHGVKQTIEVFDTPSKASFGVISDIDDTMMRTGAHSIWLNLWTSITGNPTSREVFPDAIRLMSAYAAQGAQFFYVSSSPWNLHGYLREVFRRSGLPKGPMFLRDLGLSDTQFVTGTHDDHKGRAIETILTANPDLCFVLIGDTGQHDAEIYERIAANYPKRIARIILREPTSRARMKVKSAIEASRRRGFQVDVASTFDHLA